VDSAFGDAQNYCENKCGGASFDGDDDDATPCVVDP
jgi:hypothetical protein